MYHDLLAFSPWASRSSSTSLLTASNMEIDWAVTEWRVVPNVRFAWPAPPSTTFFDYDRFRAAWNDIIKNPDVIRPTGQEHVFERLTFAWLSIGTAVVAKEQPALVKTWDGKLPWANLITRLNAMASAARSDPSADSNRYSEWLKRIAELLMPEMGLPDLVIRWFMKLPPVLKQLWIDHRASVRQRRVEKLKELYEVDPGFAEHLRLAPLGAEFTPQRDEIMAIPERPASREQ